MQNWNKQPFVLIWVARVNQKRNSFGLSGIADLFLNDFDISPTIACIFFIYLNLSNLGSQVEKYCVMLRCIFRKPNASQPDRDPKADEVVPFLMFIGFCL